MVKIRRNFGFTTEELCKGAVNFARMTSGENDGGNTVVAITGHESDAKNVSDSFVDFSVHFVIKTDSDNVLKVQDRLIKDIDILLREKYGLDDYVEVNDAMVKGFEGDDNE